METKPAIYTSELWTTVIIQIILTLNTLHIWDYAPGKWGHILTALAQALLAGLYALARGIAKNQVGIDPLLPANRKLFPRKKDMTRH